MNIKDALYWAQKYLSTHHIASFDSEVLLAFVMGETREYLFTFPEKNLSASETKHFRRAIQKRAQSIPVAYITRSKGFYGLDFFINENVLVPRPDTETLVECALNFVKHVRSKKRIHLLEIGTGSGCIAIALKKNLPHADITATDISKTALVVARQNARRHRCSIHFLASDLFHSVPPFAYDIIVSNPPYLSSSEAKKKSLLPEPPISLTPFFMTPKKMYTEFLRQSLPHMHSSTHIFLEIGCKQSSVLVNIIKKYFPQFQFRFHKDLGGIQRVIEVYFRKH